MASVLTVVRHAHLAEHLATAAAAAAAAVAVAVAVAAAETEAAVRSPAVFLIPPAGQKAQQLPTWRAVPNGC